MRSTNDPRQFAALLYEGGYATDPAYADKLVALMDRYDLYRLDA
jgi:flagellar protein FlgJ